MANPSFVGDRSLAQWQRAVRWIALGCVSPVAFAAGATCVGSSGSTITPVVELFTSEGCSSCPPADRWASTFKHVGNKSGNSSVLPVVVQAFHVGYWDSIRWVDRFAAPAYTQRQQAIVARQQLRSAYTPRPC